jgi:hypothetical protein
MYLQYVIKKLICRFPDKDKQPDRYREWAVACRRAEKKPTKWSLVCSAHFKETDINRTGQNVRLRVQLSSAFLHICRYMSLSWHFLIMFQYLRVWRNVS